MKKNIIHKVQVEINTTSMATANALKSTMDEIIHTRILPSIEVVLERFKHLLLEDESLQINTLDLDVTIDRGRLESKTLSSEIEEQLERIMAEIQHEKTAKKTDYFISSDAGNQLNDVQYPEFGRRSISTQTKELESFFFFLRTGMKPWWISDNTTMKALLEPDAILRFTGKQPELFSTSFIKELHVSVTRKRFVIQFPDQLIQGIVSAAFSRTSIPAAFFQRLNELPSLINEVNNTFRITIWEILIAQLLERSENLKTTDLAVIVDPIIRIVTKKKATAPELEVTWKTIVQPVIELILLLRNEQRSAIEPIKKVFLSQHTEATLSEKNSSEKSEQTEFESVIKPAPLEATKTEQQKNLPKEGHVVSIPKEGMLFEHAGLVLLSPFLKHLFTRTGLMDNHNQLTDKTMAAHVLYYVATGNETPWEFDTTFEKYIVGIDFNEPLERHCIISDTVKTEVKSMLQAVKDNWTPMQNSSDELLRYEYLQRPGKLIIDGQQHRLVMERKTQDILLDKLSWAISIVRFPWNKEILYVEW